MTKTNQTKDIYQLMNKLVSTGENERLEKLRDFFAAAALTGLLSYNEKAWRQEEKCRWSFEIADAMIKQREKKDV